MSKANPSAPELHGGEHNPDGNDPLNYDKIWPVGSIHISVSPTNPSDLMGFGTWTAFGAGRVLVGLDGGDASFDTVEETGGEKTQTSGQASVGATQRGSTANTLTPRAHTHDTSVLQPYIVVYMWKRTA